MLLRDMGVAHWVGDRHKVKRNAAHALGDYFFNPEWVKKPVYDVVRTTTATTGIVRQARLDEILKQSGIEPDPDGRRVTALMLACELCFKVQGVDEKMVHYLLVDQVPAKPPGVVLEWPPNSRKKLIWQFDFLPDHLLSQLLGRWFPWRDTDFSYFRDEIVLRSKDREECRVRLAARRDGHLLELEYHAQRDCDWQRMHAKIESEVESLLDPEGLKRRAGTELWSEIDPQEEPRKTLKPAEEQNIVVLAEKLLRITKISLEYEEDLRDGLRKRFLKSLEIKQLAPRLAYRACYVVSCAINLAGKNGLDEGFPLEANMRNAVVVGKWLNQDRHVEIKELLRESVVRELKTLEPGDSKQPFDSLRKAYVKAVEELGGTDRTAEIGDPSRHAVPRQLPRTDDRP
jgi:hypothetical protein